MILVSPLLAAAGVRHGFSTRAGGVSEGPFASLNLGGSVGDDPARVAENVRRLAARAGAAFATVHQVHGDRVVEAAGPLLATEADAVISATPGLAPAVKTADCVPILLVDRRSGRVAAVHAGWRGTRLRIAARAVDALAPAGGDLLAAIGPCIGACCYEVSPELAAEFAAAFGPEVVSGRRLDLVGANRLVLREAGLGEAAIDVVRACTACDEGRFFSHRRDRGRTGRHLSYVVPPGGAG